eukprot:TRINITY_DN12455_c0_g1_i1.p1 TRINITY_DN12455_c0_g1~~TRINITY_DN12455_c0_g1_i1.p1  ORF type:complete len:409 (-),score=42.22 TRINITY_DN12455_c0_g1_i1:20-1222(-)
MDQVLLIPDIVYEIVSYLNTKELLRTALTCRAWQSLITSDVVWRNRCLQDWDIDKPIGPPPTLLQFKSFYQTYGAWFRSFGKYQTYYLPASRSWRSLENWLQVQLPSVYETLNPGATEEELDEAEKALEQPLPLAARVIYRIHNGQNPNSCQYKGLFGGYQFYSHHINVEFIPIDIAARISRKHPNYLFFAISRISSRNKIIVLNLLTGIVGVFNDDREVIACSPAGATNDGMLQWFMNYANKLSAGEFQIRTNPKWGRQIVLFPSNFFRAVTRHVVVEVSSIYVPENSSLESSFFSYSIRLSLEKEAQGSCQLLSRRWLVKDANGAIETVEGEGVIGKYPVLEPGGPVYTYESCTTLPTPTGSMSGQFIFVPGRLSLPAGPSFAAEIPEFLLQKQPYNY